MSDAPPASQLPIIIRAATADDVSFIVSTWLKGARSVPPLSYVSTQLYYQHQHPIVARILERASTLVACLPDDPNIIAGYLVFETIGGLLVVHWSHVKRLFGGQGVATSLAKAACPTFGTSVTVCTHIGQDFGRRRKKHNLTYDPFLINQQPTEKP